MNSLKGMKGMKGVKETNGTSLGERDKDVFMSALKTTIPVFLGYNPLGLLSDSCLTAQAITGFMRF
jgi:predicted branched-subunit amino acid permease